MTSKEALDILLTYVNRTGATLNGDKDLREAIHVVSAEISQLRKLANRSIDAGVTRWHNPGIELELVDWLELSDEEYADWVQQTGVFTPDHIPYRLDDDEAILRGVSAVRKMLIMRVGDQHRHAQAFREALSGGSK